MVTAFRHLLDKKTEEVHFTCKIYPGMEERSRLVFPKQG
jgi:hypothetical protein